MNAPWPDGVSLVACSGEWVTTCECGWRQAIPSGTRERALNVGRYHRWTQHEPTAVAEGTTTQ